MSFLFPPHEARALATSLLALADDIDAIKGQEQSDSAPKKP
jgi:hypothetical protein